MSQHDDGAKRASSTSGPTSSRASAKRVTFFYRGIRATLGMLACMAVALVVGQAHAAGSFSIKTKEVSEVSGGWHMFVSIDLPRPPAIAHVPLKFNFTKLAVDERTLIDNHDQPVHNRMVLQNQTPSIESLDVDFADASGKIFKGTRFDFFLTRGRGYEAGEYKVQVRTSDGADVGSPQSLTLKGDNPVVDRRSITFEAKSKKVDTGLDGGNIIRNKASDDTTAAPESQEVQPVGSAAPFIPSDAYNKQPEEEMKEHPKGCGCDVVGGLASVPGAGAAVGLLLSGIARRRRRASIGS